MHTRKAKAKPGAVRNESLPIGAESVVLQRYGGMFWTADPYEAPNPTYNYNFYGITGQKLATLTCNASNYPAYPTCAITGQNVYFGGKLIVSGGVNVVTDRLGSVRANGQGDSFAYYPYGEERTSTANGLDKFGTYFRDAVGQDYADQRYYASGTGAFLTADPSGMKAANPSIPTSWNMYRYSHGDPVNRYDPSGLEVVNPDCPPDDPCPADDDDDPGPGLCNVNPLACIITGPIDGVIGSSTSGSSNGAAYAGFAQALRDQKNEPDCASLIGGNSGTPYSGTALAQMLEAAPVTTSTDNGNNPVAFQSAFQVGVYVASWQLAYTNAGAIYLNGNLFPDTAQPLSGPEGSTPTIIQLVSSTYGTAMNATQFGTFVFLHELSHIVDSTSANVATIDSDAYNQLLINTCIH
jgi:RHS repeat-associated protein